MKIIFELSHPKHFYQFRYLINHYLGSGNKVKILARKKDVLLDILNEENLSYTLLGKHGETLFSKLLVIPQLAWNYNRILRNFKPDVIISKASPYALLANPFYRGLTVITPDSEVVVLTNRIVAPLSKLIITPATFKLNYGLSHKRVDGFFEETYLSPNAFRPDISVLKRYGITSETPFFLLRFIGWSANHDLGQFGFNDTQKTELVNLLLQHGKVYISSEHNTIPDVLSPHLLKIPANQIHHALHYATLYIGDSQTMATEAALLGTPSIRYNSFVGENDMSNFIVLEQKYQMLRNFNDFKLLIKEVEKMLLDKSLKSQMLAKRELYFNNKQDINLQMIRTIEESLV